MKSFASRLVRVHRSRSKIPGSAVAGAGSMTPAAEVDASRYAPPGRTTKLRCASARSSLGSCGHLGAVACVAALAVKLSGCGSSGDDPQPDPAGAAASGNSGASSAGAGSGGAGVSGVGGDAAQNPAQNPAQNQGGAAPTPTEGNVDPVGIAGTSGTSGSTGNSASGTGDDGAGGDGNGGAGGVADAAPVDCDNPPAPGPLVGWAAVPGLGLDTTTGGGDLAPTRVTKLEELQAAVADNEPRVILVRGQLEPGDIDIGSNKTLVGTCGAEVHGHLELRESSNVIVHNLTIIGYGEGDCSLDPDFDPAEGCSSGVDAISVQRNSHHIWFDHCAVRDGTDGNLDITNGADFVTISWTKFSYTPRTDDVGDDSTGAAGHRFSNLVGGTDSPDDFDDANALNVTWHHNWWADNVVERQPRVRFGQNHLFNNYYNSLTTNYCVRAGIEANLLLEGNVFDGVDDPHEFNNTDDQETANINAGADNLYIDTTSDRATGGGGDVFDDPPYDYTLDDAATVAEAVTSGAGPR